MRKIIQRRWLFTSILATTIVGLLAMTIVTGGVSTSDAEPTKLVVGKPIETKTPKKLWEEGVASHWLDANDPPMVTVKRGTSVTIPVIIQHVSKEPAPGTPITLSNFQNPIRVFGPSATKNLTEEQFDDLLAQGVPIVGEIHVNDFISFSPSTLTIPPNSSKPVMLTISIPANISDEVLNEPFHFGVTFEHDLPALGRGAGVYVKVIP